MSNDTWTATWDWAKGIWGDNSDYSFNAFFRGVASVIAEREGWEELGSSDVWHASFHTVKSARERGVDSREALVQYVLDDQCVGRWEVRF